METKDRLFLLLLLGGVGYGGYHYRDTIKERLGLDDLAPGRIKAIVLAKQAFTFDRYRPNGVFIEGGLQDGSIKQDGEIWTADRVHGDEFRVHCRFRHDGKPRTQEFEVNTASGAVRAKENASPPR